MRRDGLELAWLLLFIFLAGFLVVFAWPTGNRSQVALRPAFNPPSGPASSLAGSSPWYRTPEARPTPAYPSFADQAIGSSPANVPWVRTPEIPPWGGDWHHRTSAPELVSGPLFGPYGASSAHAGEDWVPAPVVGDTGQVIALGTQRSEPAAGQGPELSSAQPTDDATLSQSDIDDSTPAPLSAQLAWGIIVSVPSDAEQSEQIVSELEPGTTDFDWRPYTSEAAEMLNGVYSSDAYVPNVDDRVPADGVQEIASTLEPQGHPSDQARSHGGLSNRDSLSDPTSDGMTISENLKSSLAHATPNMAESSPSFGNGDRSLPEGSNGSSPQNVPEISENEEAARAPNASEMIGCGQCPLCARFAVPRCGCIVPKGFFRYLRPLWPHPETALRAHALLERLDRLCSAIECRLQARCQEAPGMTPDSSAGWQPPGELTQEPTDPFVLKPSAQRLGPANDAATSSSAGYSPETSGAVQSGGNPSPPGGSLILGVASSAPEWAASRPAASGHPLRDLELIISQSLRDAESFGDEASASALRRAAYALSRRVPLWKLVAEGHIQAAETLRLLEEYEATGDPELATSLAASLTQLQSGYMGTAAGQLGQVVSQYRNANLRVAISERLLNRLVPDVPARIGPVREIILGRPVSGRSLAETEAVFQFIPDNSRIRLRLVIEGRLQAATSSAAGPAVFFNESTGAFVAWKEIEVTGDGLKIWPAHVTARQRVQLRQVRTDFDFLPIIGTLAQEIAWSQHERSLPEAAAESRQKLEARIRREFEQESAPRLARLESLIRDRFLQPLRRLGLQPTLLDGYTSQEAIVGRWRLAGPDQLAAHSPRPRLPDGVLASFQIHQSAVNNLLEKLELAGRRCTPDELIERVATALAWPELRRNANGRDDVTLVFANDKPIWVEIGEGLMRIHLAIARLEKAPHTWENFVVRVTYRPESTLHSARLIREGVISLSGENLSFRDQIALRGIFSKTFSKDRVWTVLPASFTNRPDLGSLELVHFQLTDGWLSWAVNERIRERPSRIAGLAETPQR